ncbi:MAG: endonuclease/exonuclease/phosphatase family protein [Planctomycetota bacterium]|jgi:endonuclease/exonuclease/phosphatase family metal-dependent hydrolase
MGLNMNKVENKSQKLKKKKVTAPIVIIGLGIFVVLFLILLFTVVFPYMRPQVYASYGAHNLHVLWKALSIYNNEYNAYPPPDEWYDLLLDNTDIDKDYFICPSASAYNGTYSYAMNINAFPDSPPDVVLLFESRADWNQAGGQETLTLENHKGKGSNILFNDGSIKFVNSAQVAKLNWADKKETITASTASKVIKVLSFNIAGDSKNWQTRKSACYDLINTRKPDIIGFQELLPVNLQWALDNFSHLSWYGPTIEGSPQASPVDIEGESCRIMYDKNHFTFDADNSGAFWFTPTPDVPSEGWDDLRYCVYVRLVDKKTSDGLYIYNTHWAFGSAGQDSRTNAARILTDRIAARTHPEDPFIVTGDFNATDSDAGVQLLLQNMTAVVENRIDWIFAETDTYELISSEIISDVNGNVISDHDVLSAELKIKN